MYKVESAVPVTGESQALSKYAHIC